jgi:replicative DNA helicase
MEVEMRTVTGSLDRRIIIALITSTEYCTRAIPILKADYFDSKYGEILFRWVNDYYRKYKKAPGKEITNLYRDNRGQLQDAERSLVKELLQSLSDDYESNGLNVGYMMEQTQKHVRLRSLEVLHERMGSQLETGKVDKAEKEVESYRRVLQLTSGFVNPFDASEIEECFIDAEDDVVFNLPGKLGRMAGPFQRHELTGWLAPMKRGKSFVLQEVALRSTFNNKRTVVFSLEMSKKQMKRRLIRRITAMSEMFKSGDWVYPIFDCVHNQIGDCKKAERTNRIPLFVAGDTGKPPYHPKMKYRPCTACRGHKGFSVATWFELKHRGKLDMRSALKQARAMKTMYKNNLRIRAFPAYSASISDIKAELQMLQDMEGFVAEHIVLDYADITKPEDARLSENRDRLDHTWKMIKNLGDEMDCHVSTASQSTRKSVDKKSLTYTDTAEDIRKAAHVNKMFALNQTPQEKFEGVMRISKIAEREGSFHEEAFAYVLQQPALSQIFLDSEVVYPGGRQQDILSQPWDWEGEGDE